MVVQNYLAEKLVKNDLNSNLVHEEKLVVHSQFCGEFSEKSQDADTESEFFFIISCLPKAGKSQINLEHALRNTSHWTN